MVRCEISSSTILEHQLSNFRLIASLLQVLQAFLFSIIQHSIKYGRCSMFVLDTKWPSKFYTSLIFKSFSVYNTNEWYLWSMQQCCFKVVNMHLILMEIHVSKGPYLCHTEVIKYSRLLNVRKNLPLESFMLHIFIDIPCLLFGLVHVCVALIL